MTFYVRIDNSRQGEWCEYPRNDGVLLPPDWCQGNSSFTPSEGYAAPLNHGLFLPYPRGDMYGYPPNHEGGFNMCEGPPVIQGGNVDASSASTAVSSSSGDTDSEQSDLVEGGGVVSSSSSSSYITDSSSQDGLSVSYGGSPVSGANIEGLHYLEGGNVGVSYCDTTDSYSEDDSSLISDYSNLSPKLSPSRGGGGISSPASGNGTPNMPSTILKWTYNIPAEEEENRGKRVVKPQEAQNTKQKDNHGKRKRGFNVSNTRKAIKRLNFIPDSIQLTCTTPTNKKIDFKFLENDDKFPKVSDAIQMYGHEKQTDGGVYSKELESMFSFMNNDTKTVNNRNGTTKCIYNYISTMHRAMLLLETKLESLDPKPDIDINIIIPGCSNTATCTAGTWNKISPNTEELEGLDSELEITMDSNRRLFTALRNEIMDRPSKEITLPLDTLKASFGKPMDYVSVLSWVKINTNKGMVYYRVAGTNDLGAFGHILNLCPKKYNTTIHPSDLRPFPVREARMEAKKITDTWKSQKSITINDNMGRMDCGALVTTLDTIYKNSKEKQTTSISAISARVVHCSVLW